MPSRAKAGAGGGLGADPIAPSPRPELPREFVASHKRRRMMDAIAELTAEQGYEATKIADIVRRAGVARKTLYDNFDGKEDLFLSAFDAPSTRCGRGRGGLRGGAEGDWEERIVAGLARLLDFVAEHPAAGADVHGRGDLGHAQLGPALRRRRCSDFVELLRAQRSRRTRACRRRSRSRWSAASPGSCSSRSAAARPSRPPELLPELSQFVLSPYLGVGKVVEPGGESDSTVADSNAGWSDYPGDATGFRPSSSREISASG